MLCLRRPVALLSFLLLGACSATGGVAPADAAPVEAAVRALLSGYAESATGDQAVTVIGLFGTPALVDRLKAQAQACRAAEQAGQEMPATCGRDPLFCSAEPAPVGGVSVKSVAGTIATAEVQITAPSGALTTHFTLSKVGDGWKVDNVTCP